VATFTYESLINVYNETPKWVLTTDVKSNLKHFHTGYSSES
jgi:hypothetical protein